MAFVMDEICQILETHAGRDKVIRTLCYSSKLIGCMTDDNKLADRLNRFGKHMSQTRSVMRLLDDIPMLKTTIEYGIGRSEPDSYMASMGVLDNIISQLYYPVDKISWLAENDLISVKDPSFWDTTSSVCWVVSIYLNLMRSLRHLNILQSHKKCLLDKPLSEINSIDLLNLKLRQQLEMLATVRFCLDFVHAVNTLPPGYLWSSRLKPWHVNLIATVSSFLGLYQLVWKRSIAKSKAK